MKVLLTMLENISGHSNSSHLMVFVMFKGLQPSTISICNLLLPTDSKVFDRNKNSSALNSGPCASIVSCPPHKYKHAMARIVNCLLAEIGICCTSSYFFLTWKITIWSMVRQFQISRRFEVISVSIISCLLEMVI